MSESERKPDSFDWVEARIACLPAKQLEAMLSEVEAAVKKRNDEEAAITRQGHPRCVMELTKYDGGKGFCVTRKIAGGAYPPQQAVNFELGPNGNGIVIRNGRAQQESLAVPFLDGTSSHLKL